MQEEKNNLDYWEYVLYKTKKESVFKSLFITMSFIDKVGELTCDIITKLTGVKLL